MKQTIIRMNEILAYIDHHPAYMNHKVDAKFIIELIIANEPNGNLEDLISTLIMLYKVNIHDLIYAIAETRNMIIQELYRCNVKIKNMKFMYWKGDNIVLSNQENNILNHRPIDYVKKQLGNGIYDIQRKS